MLSKATILCEYKQNSKRRPCIVRKKTVRRFFKPLVGMLLITLALSVTVKAQTPAAEVHANAAGSQPLVANTSALKVNPASQAVINALASLPEADMILYTNPQRILNEVAPALMPVKDVENMRKAFEDIKKNAGVDPTRIDYIVIATRFKKPTADLNFQPPELMVLASGDFSAEALIGLARMASQGKLRDEKYGAKTLGLMTIEPLVKEAEKNPLLKAFTEVGIVAINGNTIAAGTPGYLRAAIDAADGKDRISAETLNSLVRDTNALISISGSPWHSFSKSFGMLGTDTTPRAARCESKLGDLYAALTMDATNFMIRGASNADNPDTAKIISRLYSGLLGYAANSIPDPSAKSLLKSLVITAEGDEVLLRADFSRQMVKEMIEQKMKPKKMEATVTAPAPAKKTPVTRRRGRRRAN
jgi:hypothetical protein